PRDGGWSGQSATFPPAGQLGEVICLHATRIVKGSRPEPPDGVVAANFRRRATNHSRGETVAAPPRPKTAGAPTRSPNCTQSLTAALPVGVGSGSLPHYLPGRGHRYAFAASRARRLGETRSCMLTTIPATRYTTVTQVHMRAPANCWSSRAVRP